MFNVTPTSGGCSVVAGATKCTLTLGAPVGNDAFAISTYSGLNGTGAVLDTATMTFAIAANVGLQNNSGPTQTIADQLTSPVRHAIPFAGGVCGLSGPATDQRGDTRGAGGLCDIGAYEFP